MKTERILLISVISIKILLVLAVLFLFGEGRLIWADTMHYSGLGRNIFLGNGFSFSDSGGTSFVPTTAFMPLYPFVLGFFSLYVPHGFAVLSLLQAIVAGFSALFAFRIALFFLPAGWSLAAALLFVFEPLVSAIHILMMPETLFVLFVLAFSYYLLRNASENNTYDWYRAALFFVLALYTKPAALYLMVPAILFTLSTKNWLRNIFVFVSIIVIALVPWILRNHAVSGQYIITSNAAKNACHWGVTGIVATEHRLDSSNWDTTVHLPEYKEIQSRCSGMSDALQIFLLEYPVPFAKLMAASTVSILTNDGYTVLFEKSPDEQVKIHHNYLTPAVFVNADWQKKIRAALQEFSAVELFAILAGKIFWFAVSVAAVAGAVVVLRRRATRAAALFLVLVTGYFVFASGMAAGLAAGARYRYQVDAFLLILALVGIHALYQKKWFRLPETRDIHDVDDPSTTLLYGRIIQKKPFLRRLYVDFYNQLKELLPRRSDSQLIVELGSGGGFIKEIIPHIITSDVIPLPDIDKQFSALAMPFQDNTVDAFVMLNVLHHIGDTKAFLKELNRCLKIGGKIIMIEPANTLWGRFVYRHFHPEPFDPSAGWGFVSEGPLSSANGAIPWIVFYRDRIQFEKEFSSLHIRTLKPHTPFRYLISGGVSSRQFLPSFMYNVIKGIEIAISPFNAYLGMFLTIEIEKIS